MANELDERFLRKFSLEIKKKISSKSMKDSYGDNFSLFIKGSIMLRVLVSLI